MPFPRSRAFTQHKPIPVLRLTGTVGWIYSVSGMCVWERECVNTLPEGATLGRVNTGLLHTQCWPTMRGKLCAEFVLAKQSSYNSWFMVGQWQQSSHENYFSELSQGHTQELKHRHRKERRAEWERAGVWLVGLREGWRGYDGHWWRKGGGALRLCRHTHTLVVASEQTFKVTFLFVAYNPRVTPRNYGRSSKKNHTLYAEMTYRTGKFITAIDAFKSPC